MFHQVLLPVLALTLIGACVNLYKSWGDHSALYSASLILVLVVCVILAALSGRLFALRAQDRAIRAEENFRHFLLAGKPLDPALTIRQIIALRFASDAEFPALAARAAREQLPAATIKQSIKSWRPDLYRV